MADETDTGGEPTFSDQSFEMKDWRDFVIRNLHERMAAMEARERSLQDTIKDLADRIEELEDGAEGGGGPMLFGALPPGAEPKDDGDTQEHDAERLVYTISDQILRAGDDSKDFAIDNVQVEAVVGLGLDTAGQRAKVTTNARQQANSQQASRITFSVRRRRPTVVLDSKSPDSE